MKVADKLFDLRLREAEELPVKNQPRTISAVGVPVGLDRLHKGERLALPGSQSLDTIADEFGRFHKREVHEIIETLVLNAGPREGLHDGLSRVLEKAHALIRTRVVDVPNGFNDMLRIGWHEEIRPAAERHVTVDGKAAVKEACKVLLLSFE